jgi:hypothetical protein
MIKPFEKLRKTGLEPARVTPHAPQSGAVFLLRDMEFSI